MSKFNLHNVNVFLTTKKYNVKTKLNEKIKNTKQNIEAKRKIVKSDVKTFKTNLSNGSFKIKYINYVEKKKTHKLKLFSTTKITKIKQKRKNRKDEIHAVRLRAYLYVTWRDISMWKNRVFYNVEHEYTEFKNHFLGKTWKKLCSFVPIEPERQVLILSLTMLVMYFTFESTIFQENALLVYANNEYLGTIEKSDVADMENIIDDLLVIGDEEVGDAKLSEKGITDIQIDLVPARTDKEELSTYTDVLQKLTNLTPFKIQAYDVVINGESVGYISDKEIYDSALEKYIATYLPEETEGVVVTDVRLQDEIMLSKTETYSYKLITEQQLIGKMAEPITAEKSYEVSLGDSLWQIANDNDLTLEEFLEINPEITENSSIYPGQMVNLVKKVPRVSVVVTVEHTYTDIAYRDIEEVPNDEQYVTYKKTIQEGSDGKSIFTIETKSINGLEYKRKTLSEEVLVAPVNKIVEVGTMNTPPKSSVGSFKMPASGRLNDGFAARGGAHKGIDICAPAGTPVYASDGGVVKFAGWYPAYGNLVIIDHQNGFETYYAHNTKLYVSVGQKVYQGQHIAAMGSTGRSTGNHCHFEIRKNGIPVNPMKYLR